MSFVFLVIGLGGVPDDIETWSSWIQKFLKLLNYEPSKIVFIILTFVALVFVFYARPSDIWRRYLCLHFLYRKQLNQIQFEPDSPLKQWRSPNGTQASQPKIMPVDPEKDITGANLAVQITGTKDDALDCMFANAIPKVRLIEFVGKFSTQSILYVHIKAKTPDNLTTAHVWLNIASGAGGPLMSSSFENEWRVLVPIDPIGNSWVSQKVRVKNLFNRTFGKLGYQYQGVSGFRLRGEMTIAAIRMYGISLRR